MKKAIGRRGSWFAEVAGEKLPCIHRHWLKVFDYHDPFDRRHEAAKQRKIAEYVDAIRSAGRVILTDDDAIYDPDGKVSGFSRTSYIAIYGVDNVSFDTANGLTLQISTRLENLE